MILFQLVSNNVNISRESKQLNFFLCFFTDLSIKNEDEDKLDDNERNGWDEEYSCEYCDQTFNNANDLVDHRETHTHNSKFED